MSAANKPEYKGDHYFLHHHQHGAWTQTGRCVYCPCGQRLYHGFAPETRKEQLAMAHALEALVKCSIVPIKATGKLEPDLPGKRLGKAPGKRRIDRRKPTK